LGLARPDDRGAPDYRRGGDAGAHFTQGERLRSHSRTRDGEGTRESAPLGRERVRRRNRGIDF